MSFTTKTARLKKGMAPVLVCVGGLFLAFLFLLLDNSLLGLELRTLDLRFRLRGPEPVSDSPLVLVEVDNRSYKDLDARWPFSRAWHAHVLQNLLDAGARAVVFDIMFTESASQDPEGDRALADVLARARQEGRLVILSGEIIQERLPDGSSYRRLDAPLPLLLESGMPWGLVDDIMDRDRINRRYNLFQKVKGTLYPTIGTRLLMELEGVERFDTPTNHVLNIGSRQLPLVRGLQNIMRINYRGPAGSFPRYSFSSILDDADFDLANPDLDSDYMELMKNPELYTAMFGDDDPPPFKDKIVLIGVSADDLHDNKSTPWQGAEGSAREMPGVETHAHAIQTMLDGRFVEDTPWTGEILIIAMMAVAGMIIVLLLGPVPSALVVFLLMGLWFWFCKVRFVSHDQWLPLLAPLAALAGSWVSGIVQQFLRARRERQEVRNVFSRYVSRAVVNEVLRNPAAVALGGEERVITALFSDIAGFTTISESLTPDRLQILLNEYLSEMTNLIFEQGGILDKYIGDAIVAEFGAPLPTDDHAIAAVRTAVRMQQKLLQLQKKWKAEGYPLVRARIGINTGLMAVGNFGSHEIYDYTAIGDNMNLAARLEGANKFFGTLLMVSQTTWNELSGGFVGRELDCIRVKGKDEGVAVYEVLCATSDPEAEDALRRCELYAKGRAEIEQRNWQLAMDRFNEMLEHWPEDGPATEMLRRCRGWLTEPPAPDWDGVTAFEEK